MARQIVRGLISPRNRRTVAWLSVGLALYAIPLIPSAEIGRQSVSQSSANHRLCLKATPCGLTARARDHNGEQEQHRRKAVMPDAVRMRRLSPRWPALNEQEPILPEWCCRYGRNASGTGQEPNLSAIVAFRNGQSGMRGALETEGIAGALMPPAPSGIRRGSHMNTPSRRSSPWPLGRSTCRIHDQHLLGPSWLFSRISQARPSSPRSAE
jgi:hypothetical protein